MVKHKRGKGLLSSVARAAKQEPRVAAVPKQKPAGAASAPKQAIAFKKQKRPAQGAKGQDASARPQPRGAPQEGSSEGGKGGSRAHADTHGKPRMASTRPAAAGSKHGLRPAGAIHRQAAFAVGKLLTADATRTKGASLKVDGRAAVRACQGCIIHQTIHTTYEHLKGFPHRMSPV
jgi:hypothetical protein